MSFAIEVPGAATPLSRIELCRVLESASSHDASKRQAAGQQLSSWEANPDYYPALQTVFLDKTLPRDIRLLAIIQLKNGIDRFWRYSKLKNAIQPAEKHLVRSHLFQGTIDEPDEKLALHNALVTAKIVRTDFPTEWPDPLENILAQINAVKDEGQRLARALVILLQVVKELGAARLPKSQSGLQGNAPALVQVLCEIYGDRTSLWITSVVNGQPPVAMAMENSLMAFKILRRLLIVGYRYPHKDEVVRQVWAFSRGQFEQFLPIVSDTLPAIGKHLLQFTKLHIEMAEKHPASFAFFPDSINLSQTYWNLTKQFSLVYENSEGIRQGTSSHDNKSRIEGPLLERLALKGLLLMRACVKMAHNPIQTIQYRSKEDAAEQKQALANLKVQLFSEALIGEIVETVVTRFFKFRKADMDAWEEDPQEWEHQEESQGNAYEWEVRPCSEKVFLDILTQYSEHLLPPLLTYFDRPLDGNDVLEKEAIYTAMGLAAPFLESTPFDFDAVLRMKIVPEAQQNGPLCQILRRRLAILLSQWIPIRIAKESRPMVYEIFRHFLNPNDHANDLVIRITAARQLKIVVDELGFDEESFVPFAPDVLKELIGLVKAVEIEETKLAILETLRSLIARMETHVIPFSEMITRALPEIWESANELGMMIKQSILVILYNLVSAMRTDSQRYQHIILPLVAEATQPNTEIHVYLIDEALELWKAVLQNSQPPLSADLLSLAESSIRGLEQLDERSGEYQTLVGSYLMLAPDVLLGDNLRRPLLAALSAGLDAKSREDANIACRYIQDMMTLSDRLGGKQGFGITIRDIVEAGFLQKVLEGIHNNYEANQTSGPKKKKSTLSAVALGDYFTILARIATIDPTTFIEMLGSLAPIADMWTWLSSEWFASFDSISDPTKLKLNLIGITRLLELPQPMARLLLPKLQDYFSMWTSVITQYWDEDVPGGDSLRRTERHESATWDSPQDLVEKEMWFEDPVQTVVSLDFVKERLQGLAAGVGEAIFQEWLGNVDRDVIESFQKIGTKVDG
ncbi:putative importin 11 [Xylariaceae sp. FL1272]|nr:putative importin 11 [Xylariaceae sp. FL1272]